MLSTDPIDLLRDNDGDIVIPPQFVGGSEGVRQQMILNLQDVKGEWFLDRDKGPAWLPNDIVGEDSILGNKFSEARLRAELRQAIFETVAVTEIISFSAVYTSANRSVTVRAEVKFVFDDLVDTLTIAETF